MFTVGVQFQAKAAPFSVQTHCIAHRLNLAVTGSIKHVDALKKFSEKFGQLYNYISASGNRTYALKQMQTLLDEPELSVKEPYSIRWLGLKRAVEAAHACYGSVCPNMAKIGAIALCMQVTSVECERSFSTQNRIKSKFR